MRNLPPRMHLKDGGYYYVRSNKWTHLSRDREHAFAIYTEMTGVELDPKDYRIRSYAVAFLSARKNAVIREISFALNRDEFVAMVARSRGRCEVTGLTFDTRTFGSKRRRPLAPSLDRIDSAGGYNYANCRLICIAANMLLGEWGEDVASVVAAGLLRVRERKRLRDGLKIWRPLEIEES